MVVFHTLVNICYNHFVNIDLSALQRLKPFVTQPSSGQNCCTPNVHPLIKLI